MRHSFEHADRTNQSGAETFFETAYSPNITIYLGGFLFFMKRLVFPYRLFNNSFACPWWFDQKSPYLLSSKAINFLPLGSSSQTGKNVMSELLSQGHTAVATVHIPGSIMAHSSLTVVTGSLLSRIGIGSALHAAPLLTPSAASITLTSDSPYAAQLSSSCFLAREVKD